MTRIAALLAALSPAELAAWTILAVLVIGIIIGITLLALVVRWAVRNGRGLGWCVLICIVAFAANAQRLPGRRVPTPGRQSAVDTLRFLSDQYPNGGGPMWIDGTTFTFRASDGLSYTCTMKSGACDFDVPKGVTAPRTTILADCTVTTPDGFVIVWKNGTREDGTKTITIADKISIGGVKPPDPPIRKGRGRVVLPPMVIPVGVELHAMPSPVLLNFITKSTAPGTYIVIMSSDGKTWIIWQVQGGLPTPPGYRKVWP